eukprot:gene5952-2966_t
MPGKPRRGSAKPPAAPARRARRRKAAKAAGGAKRKRKSSASSAPSSSGTSRSSSRTSVAEAGGGEGLSRVGAGAARRLIDDEGVDPTPPDQLKCHEIEMQHVVAVAQALGFAKVKSLRELFPQPTPIGVDAFECASRRHLIECESMGARARLHCPSIAGEVALTEAAVHQAFQSTATDVRLNLRRGAAAGDPPPDDPRRAPEFALFYK